MLLRLKSEIFNGNIFGGTGWYPEVVFLTVVFLNSGVTEVLIQNTSVFETFDTLFFKFFSSKSGQIMNSSLK